MSLSSAIRAAALLVAASAVPASAVPIIGVNGPNTLIQFDSATPGNPTRLLTVTGLAAGDPIVGLDTRPSNGVLYALTRSGALVTIDTMTGAASPVTTIPGSGPQYGFSFNPVPDALRIVNTGNQNLRITMLSTTPTTNTDTPLAYRMGDPNEGVDPAVTAAGYTNQNPGPQTMTTLYVLDAGTDSLLIQAPANAGLLATVGMLGVDLAMGGAQSLDIDGASGVAFASLQLADGSSGFYSIDLTTGMASLIGRFRDRMVSDIAVGTIGGIAIPEPASMAVLGIGLAGMVAARRRRR